MALSKKDFDNALSTGAWKNNNSGTKLTKQDFSNSLSTGSWNKSKKTTISTDRADELDKLNVESTSRRIQKYVTAYADEQDKSNEESLSRLDKRVRELEGKKTAARHEVWGASFTDDDQKQLDELKKTIAIRTGTATAAQLRTEEEQAEYEKQIANMSALERLGEWGKNLVSGATKQYAAGTLDTNATLYEAGKNFRSAYNNTAIDDAKRNYETAVRDLDIMKSHKDEYTDKEISDQERMVETTKAQYESFSYGLSDKIQNKAIAAARDFDARIAQSGAEDVQRAVDVSYLGEFGKVATEGAASAIQSAMDGALSVGLATPGIEAGRTMIPFAVRCFGNSAMVARNSGKDIAAQVGYGIASSAIEIATEKMGNVGLQKMAYGKGFSGYEDRIASNINKAVQSLADKGLSVRGQEAVKLGLVGLSGMYTEGLEEFVGDALEIPLTLVSGVGKLPYNTEEWMTEATRDFAVGALSALVGYPASIAKSIVSNKQYASIGKDLRAKGFSVRSEIEKASVIDNDFAKEVHEAAWRQYKSSGDVTDTVLGQLYSVNQQELARLYTQAQLLDRGMTLLETANGQVTPTSFKNEVNVQSTVTANTDIQEVLNKAKNEMRSGQVSTATQAQMRSTMAKHSEELTALGLDNMAAYYDTNSVIEQRKTDAVNAVVGTQTLDSIATAYLNTTGKNLPKDVAQSKAEVVQKLLNGEAITQIEVNKLLLNSPAFVQTFNDVTGTNLTAKNNYTVKEVTDAVNEVLQKKEEVASALRELIENSRYAGLEEPTIVVNGKEMTYEDFRKFVKEEIPDGDKLTEEEILKEFNDTLAIQRGENSGEQLLSTEQGRADGEPERESASEMGRDGERPPESEAEERGNEEAGSEQNAGGSNQSVSLDTLRTTEWRPNPKLKATQVFLEEDYDKIPGAMELKALVEESGAMLIVTKDAIDTGAVDENGNTIYADAANHTAMNIIAVQAGTDIPLLVRGKHELFHRLLGTNTRSKGAFNKFARLMKQSNVLQVVRDAYDNTSGAYTNVLGDFGKNDMSYLEEFACDLYANYNRDESIDTEVFSLLRDTVLPDFMNHKTTNPDNVRDTIDKLVVARYGVGEEDDFQYSIDSMTEAAGLTFEKDGHRTVLKNRNGDAVNEVTKEMIDKSPLGAIIKEGKKRNKDIDVGEQEQFFADLYNLMIRTNDIDLIWAVSSSVGFQPIESGARDPSTLNTNKSKFAALTKNSDKQYNKTIDFTTICVKTQAIIDAMSATMLKLGHGLTDKEIVDIVYKNTHDAGEPVPCPVCYVFSRWVGLGGLFDKMKNLQIRYENADLSELKEALSVLDKQATAIAKAKGVKGGEAREALYKEMQERFTELQSKQNLATISGKNQLTAEELTEYDDLKRDLDILDNWTWVKTVRLSKNYKPVPDDILFDINAGKRFAEEYPESWKFRTTRGPAMGKAATPYADERIGQIIRGIAIADLKDLGDMSKNEILKSENGELNAKAKAQLSNAIKKARVQNLLGGQRWQSTSDFRFVYALDYLLSFVELQAVGSYSQLYTKVAESVPMFASVNADTNCSLMPKGIGYHMENGVPTLGLDDFSNVTGMDIRDALNMLKEYDCVQDIIVGTSDTHIRLCMRSDFILDIIPFHASGSAEARYRSMMQTIEESVESRDDYSAYQTDHKMADRTEQQKKAYDLRIKLLTGKLGTLSDSDKQILKGNEILHNLYMRFYGLDADGNTANIDMKYLNADDRAANRTDHDSDCYGAFLTKDQAEMVMPFEYWDHTSTIKTAPEQGRAFREYCESLGLHPRFTGWTDKNYNAEKDFSDEDGYWKTLIDRRMYDRDGNYREQKAIDVSKFNADYLFREPSVEGIYKPSIVNDPTKTEQIAEKSARMVAEGRGEAYEQNAGMQFSVRKEAPPKNTVKAYKLMRLDEAGNLHPLFIDSQQIVKVGTWYNADSPDLSWVKNLPVGDHLVNLSTGESVPYEQYANEHNISKRVKPNNADVKWAEENGYRFMHIEDKADSKQAEAFAAKYGDSRAYYNWGINGSSKTSDGQGTASLYALRPGWHFGEVPSMGQIGYGEKGNEFRLDNQVWVEVEMAADVNYQQEAESNASKDIPSHIPTDGYYTYATNPVQKKSKTGTSENDAQKADWYVAGAFKINRILSDSEADTIVQQNNAEKGKNIPLDYRRLNGRVFNAKTMQLEDAKRSSIRGTEYLELAKDPEKNKDALQQMTYEAARKAGYAEMVAHGTNNAVFTAFDIKKSQYGISIFTSPDRGVAANYADTTAKPIKTRLIGTQVSNAEDAMYEIARLGYSVKDDGNGYYLVGRFGVYNKEFDEKELIEYANGLREKNKGGVYQLYAKVGRQLKVDAKGRNWNEIKFEYGNTTDKIAEYAMKHGYNSVYISNVRDGGGMVYSDDVLILFDANQVKSADPVTYDDAGNIIPLPERFNDKNEDIRFSIVSKSGDKVTRGLLIDDKGFAYSQKIKSFEKKGETRESRDAFLDNVAKTGERIALTRSGVGDFKAYATTKIGEPEFISAKDWEARRTDTQVPKNSKYDLKPDADGKWYYPFVDLEVLDEEVAPTSHSPRYARFDAKDLTGNTEVDKWVSNTKYSVQARTATFFSGAGTVDYALRNLIDSQIAVEYDAKIAAVYKMNNGEDIFIGDVRDVDVTQFPEGQIEYFHASPVCKNYSMAKIADEADNQIDITTAEATANALKQFKPKVFTVENVARYRDSKAMKIITDALDELGYSYDKNVYRATDFGGATIRERMFLRAVAPDGVLPEIQKTEGTNWYDAVYDLIPGLKEEAMPDWMAARLPAMGIKSVKDITEPLLIIGGNKGGKLSMAWYNQPSPTILANTHDARIVMPGGKVLRVSPRVLARIQGLPDSFKLPDKTTLAFKVIGNGVPVQLTQGIVSPLLEANIADNGIKFSISPDARKALDSALGKYGAQEQSSRDARDVKFPKQMTDNTKTMRTERTVANAAATPVGRIDTIQQAVVDQKFEYTTVTNKEAYQRAETELKTLGWRQTVENWTKAVRGGRASVSLVATGAALLNHAGNSNASGEEYLDILIDYSTLLHNASQATQAAQILQKLTPDGRLYSVMKTVNRLNNSMREKAESEIKKAKSKGEYDPSKVSYREIKISDDLIERFRAAQTDEERDAIIDEMAQYVADQVKANKADLVNAIRYLNMLGNFKTQIRNVMGNVAFQPVRLMKDASQGILESMMGVERTTGAKRDLATYKAGLEVYYQYRLAVMSGGKYNDNAGVNFDSLVADKRAIFTQTKNEFFNNTAGKVFEKYRNLTNTAMEKGDDVFCAFTFADSLARFMASRNTTWENASEELRTIAVNMAIKEAAEATYRDNNALSNWIASLARGQNTPEFIRVVAEGILPFRKTPTNILVRAYEYSPISIIPNTIRTIRYTTGKNELSGTDIADMWAKSFSGTVLVAIGFALSAMGKLIGKAPDDDKEKALFDQKGLQAYSLVAFGRTFTLDWAAPSCIPLFIGANLFQSAMEDGLTMQEFMEAFTTRLADPIMEMSILQGVNDAIENVATYGSDQALVSFIMNAAWSYLTQLTSNTLLGQAERAYQNVRMQTYVDKNGWLPVTVQRGVGKTSAKVPGWDYNQIPYINAWGEVEGNARNEFANIMQQLFAPWYVSQVDTSNMMTEIDRLYNATNDGGVILETADKYFTIAGQRKDLTAAEYMTYSMARGQVAKSAVNDLMKSASYKSLSDAEKVAAIKRVYDYANQKAKASVTNQYTPDKWVTEGMQTLSNAGVSAATYATLYSSTAKAESYKDSNGESVDNSKSLKIMQQIYSTPGLSDEQVQALAEELGVNKTVRKYSSKIVDRKLEAMEKKYGN